MIQRSKIDVIFFPGVFDAMFIKQTISPNVLKSCVSKFSPIAVNLESFFSYKDRQGK